MPIDVLVYSHEIHRCCCLFFSFSVFADQPEIAFARDQVKLEGCPFSLDDVAAGFGFALGNIEKINPRLVGKIRSDAFRKHLKVICDVGPLPLAVFYDRDDDTIHLRRVSPSIQQSIANLFHEFLHFYGIEHIDIKTWDLSIFKNDPVYACHFSAFPKFMKARVKDEFVMDAETTAATLHRCAQVQPVTEDLRGTKY